MMLHTAIPMALGIFFIALGLATWRLIAGPDIVDRILALDTIYVNALAIVVLAGIWFDTKLYFEVALAIAMLGFIGTVSLSQYLLRGDIVE